MSNINWYPGHMAKSFRELDKHLKLVDIVMILLDSRIPKSSMNPEILKRVKDKPTLILLNKSDLADKKILAEWEEFYKNQGFYTLQINATDKKSLTRIYPLVKNVILQDKVLRTLRKGRLLAPFKTMILGIPNVGKSTLINNLANRASAKVENRPGVTRRLDWYRLSDEFELLDTPGVLWPKFDQTTGLNLAITGAIRDDILPLDNVVIYAIEFLSKHYPNELKGRYLLKDMTRPLKILEQIGRSHGALLKGNEVDYERVYNIVLKDIRQNRLGGLSFERP
ncbi:MAG: ribosome biogenesis GTPase YlqF [Acholeplasmataceae bacterium]|jgi:ribosome biogenesis GTPase A